MLITYQVATAPCTDPIQVQLLLLKPCSEFGGDEYTPATKRTATRNVTLNTSHHCVTRDHLTVKVRAQLRCALLRRIINVMNPETVRVPVGPFKVVH
mgnify:CR=1 FL=1